MTIWRQRFFGWLLLAWCGSAFAWGPHPTITQAALDALGTNDALIVDLGPQAQRLTNNAWMADYRNLIYEEPGEVIYANDYLLFPEAPEHLDHICPEVKKTFRPYYMRAIQALRMENSTNASRWIGSLLHFIEDTGSPPHAAEIRGGLHSKMENWVDAREIHIRGYQPQSLGTTEEEAFKGLLDRMDKLIAYSRERAGRIRFAAEIGNRRVVEPLVLECALETSRATADLLHTLGQFVSGPSNNLCVLQGVVRSRQPEGTERFATKVVFQGSSWSTLADAAGNFEFRNLPPGKHELVAFRPGNGVLRQSVNLQPGTNRVELTLPLNSNLIRNGGFDIRWVRGNAPDCWLATRSSWEGEVIPLKIGQHYRLAAKFKPEMDAEIVARWAKPVAHALPRFAEMPRFQNQTLTAKQSTWEFSASDKLGLLQLSLRTRGQQPEQVLQSVILEVLP
jgi:hypothetical protein